jgi:hypothetical protein
MATKKNNAKKATTEPTLITKIGTQVGQVAGEIVVAKNKLVEKAGQAIDSMKSTIGSITADKKAAPKKTVKAAVKKVVKKAIKKTEPAKKAAKKAVKKIVKKSAPAKKAVKKVVKKVVKKAAGKK